MWLEVSETLLFFPSLLIHTADSTLPEMTIEEKMKKQQSRTDSAISTKSWHSTKVEDAVRP